MYYHFIPKYFADNPERECRLKSLEIPELGIHFADKEIKTIKPYPNKRYHVGCLRHGFKGRNFIGLVVETETPVTNFTKVCKWAVYPMGRDESDEPDIGLIVEHTTRYHLLDTDFPLFSDDPMMLNGWRIKDKSYPQRRPLNWPARIIASTMELSSPVILGKISDTLGDEFEEDFLETKGVIVAREQEINFHTAPIDLYRHLSANPNKKLPPLNI